MHSCLFFKDGIKALWVTRHRSEIKELKNKLQALKFLNMKIYISEGYETLTPSNFIRNFF